MKWTNALSSKITFQARALINFEALKITFAGKDDNKVQDLLVERLGVIQ